MKNRFLFAPAWAAEALTLPAVLHALNNLSDRKLTVERLAEIGAQVGSDVPYCVLGGTALAEGRGERLTPLPAMPDCHIVVCKPPFPISTPELFGCIDCRKIRCRPDTEGIMAALEEKNLAGVAGDCTMCLRMC